MLFSPKSLDYEKYSYIFHCKRKMFQHFSGFYIQQTLMFSCIDFMGMILVCFFSFSPSFQLSSAQLSSVVSLLKKRKWSQTNFFLFIFSRFFFSKHKWLGGVKICAQHPSNLEPSLNCPNEFDLFA